jgi:hypothetical protein
MKNALNIYKFSAFCFKINLALSISSTNIGKSNLLELKPPKSQPLKYSAYSFAFSANVGLSFTSSSKIPCIAETSAGIGMVGLNPLVLTSSVPSILFL